MNGLKDESASKGLCCLLVTDAQHDFCEGALPAPGGLPVVQRIAETLRRLKPRSSRPVQKPSDPDSEACNSGSAKNADCCREITSDEIIERISSPSGAAEGSKQQTDPESWCDVVVYSLDWHPPDHVSFLSSHSAKCVHSVCVCGDASLSPAAQQAASAVVDEAVSSLGLEKNWTVVVPPSTCSEKAAPAVVCLWPPHCVQNTPGSKLHREIEVHRGDFAVFKGGNSSTECFSACGTANMPTGLVPLLKSMGVATIAVCGFCLDFCVSETAMGLRAAGFADVVVLTDLTAAIHRDKERETMDHLVSQGIRCLTLIEFTKERRALSTEPTVDA
ncbi:pyrazinamidase/nicotinamidase, putative [Eimeria brunetti]|uniref:nicotinamidase n=1 Tax=Eimeria brunetti TaxID=51314 RepID=U6LDX0_9EIME|nr:pyrazinamidase/nicotinamidase, putative [Eimeria brunetti]